MKIVIAKFAPDHYKVFYGTTLYGIGETVQSALENGQYAADTYLAICPESEVPERSEIVRAFKAALETGAGQIISME